MNSNKKLKRVKTGAFERRFSMAKAGLVAGSRLAAQSAGNLLTKKEDRDDRQKEILAKQASYLVDEIGKLKGSIVKIGQMMALYGEHFLPEEVTTALHTLEDSTAILEWSAIHGCLVKSLGNEKLAELEIEETPIGAASIGQVHKAKILKTGEIICLKVQYPGVAEAVDSDLNTVETMLRVLKILPITKEFEQWFDEIRNMMHTEVDYVHELAKTAEFGERLANDDRYVVPKTYPRYSTDKVVATSYEPGLNVDSDEALELSQERRNKICEAALDLCWKEVFFWGEMQTDPNFGNYFIRTGNGNGEVDKIVLLDFGAVRRFSDTTLDPGQKIVKSAFLQDDQMLYEGLHELNFVSLDTPVSSKKGLAKLCFMAIEPFANPETGSAPAYLLNEKGEYRWGESDLPARLTLQAGFSAPTRHFALPPREVMFLTRKLMGAYTFMSVMGAELKGCDILEPYLKD